MPNAINLSGPFYTAYKAANSSFSPDTFRCAEETTADLLTTATTSDNPGMLLGKVQSGKTRTFISILALAFDNGFDIAVVLSKNSRALIEQTAKRLNSEFSMFVNDGELEIYDIMHAPSCGKPTLKGFRCKTKEGDKNPKHVLDIRLATTSPFPDQRVQLRFFDIRKRQIGRFVVPPVVVPQTP